LLLAGIALLVSTSLVATADVRSQARATVAPEPQWTTASLSQARSQVGVATIGTKGLFAGGAGRGGFSDVVGIFGNATGQWSTAALSQARSKPISATVGTKVLFAGTSGTSGGTSDRVDIYDSATGQWSTASLSEPAKDLIAATVNGKALFAHRVYGTGG